MKIHIGDTFTPITPMRATVGHNRDAGDHEAVWLVGWITTARYVLVGLQLLPVLVGIGSCEGDPYVLDVYEDESGAERPGAPHLHMSHAELTDCVWSGQPDLIAQGMAQSGDQGGH